MYDPVTESTLSLLQTSPKYKLSLKTISRPAFSPAAPFSSYNHTFLYSEKHQCICSDKDLKKSTSSWEPHCLRIPVFHLQGKPFFSPHKKIPSVELISFQMVKWLLATGKTNIWSTKRSAARTQNWASDCSSTGRACGHYVFQREWDWRGFRAVK